MYILLKKTTYNLTIKYMALWWILRSIPLMEIPGLLQPSSLSEIPTVKDPDVAAASRLLKILSLTISTRLKNWESCRVVIGP